MVGKGDRGRAQCGGAHLRSWSAQDQAKAVPGSIAPSGHGGFATSSPETSCGPPGPGGLDRLRARQRRLTLGDHVRPAASSTDPKRSQREGDVGRIARAGTLSWWAARLLTTAVFRLPSPIPKRPAKSRTGAVVASRKVGRRPVVPVAIERDVPLQVAEQLHVVSSVQIEMDTARLGNGRQENSGDIQVGLVEPEKFRLPSDQTSCDALLALRDDGMLIVRVLPAEAAEQRDGGVIGVLQITSNATADHSLQLDVLLGALQESTKAGVEPIVPA